ncbi:MAG: FtsX-like permease family protein [Candidatus Aminicenantes bacterium]|nr:FtsX-like permease family protein [Candidatus Aminicenantes bacterium]
MFRNYLKIALRNILRNKVYSIINISGLAIGMACCLLILLFIQDELSYDSYHDEADHIFRLVAANKASGEVRHLAPVGAPYAELFSSALPEIRNATRFYKHRRVLVKYEDKRFFEERFFFADPTVFDVFSFPMMRGNSEAALAAPFSVVITEAMAQKYFGDEDPTARSIILDNKHTFNITGIIRDVPPNSHFRFDFLASLETLADLYGQRFLKHPGYMSFYTYLLLQEHTDPGEFEQKLQGVVKQFLGERVASLRSFYLQPLKSIHLNSQIEFEIEPNSNMSYIYIYSAIAFFILLIASFNFMNLSTARSARRAREVGMRKILGAFRWQLIKQFLGESLILALVSLLLAVVLVILFQGLFNSLIGKELALNLFESRTIFLGFAGIVFIVGVLAGLYPAIFLSAFEPIRILKRKVGTGGKSGSFRRILVVMQFTISIVLIIGTLIIRNQLNYMRSQNLGFSKEQVVVIPIHDREARKSYESIKTEIMKNTSVISTSASSSVPGKPVTNIAYRVEDAQEDEHVSVDTFFIDHDFLETLDIKLASGRNFSQEFSTDQAEAFIINETAARTFGWSNALNKQIIWPSDLRRRDAIVKKGQVVGVIKDFNVTSLHQSIGPVLLQISPSNFRYLSVRIAPENIPRTLAFIQGEWSRFSPAYPFEYSFLDEDFDRLYRTDQKVGRIIGLFSTLAIFVACLGLFGLASFSAEQRTKEIGIRKVLGASVSGIVLFFSREFTKWVLAANLIAWPVAYFVMNKWLQHFAYRTKIGFGIFVLSALLTFVIAFVTVSYQSIKAAVANPVDSLRYE